MGIGKWISGILGRPAEEPGKETVAAKNAETTNADADNFLFALMVVASYVIQVDGKIMKSELACVEQTLRRDFSEETVKKGGEILLRMFSFAKNQGNERYLKIVVDCCQQVVDTIDYSGRLQLLTFLVQIARADGQMDDTEMAAMRDVAMWLQIQGHELHSLFYLTGDTLDDAYRLLDVSPQATDDEVKQAYANMVQIHHPDRVAGLGDDVMRGAQRKFQYINDAKERIWKARGL